MGLIRTNPPVGFGIALMFFSLAGIPPFGVFFFNIFVSLMNSSFYSGAIFVVITQSNPFETSEGTLVGEK